MKVKDILDVLWQTADYIEVTDVKCYIGGKTTREVLYIYQNEDPDEEPERIYNENYEEKEVMYILALSKGRIEIRIF